MSLYAPAHGAGTPASDEFAIRWRQGWMLSESVKWRRNRRISACARRGPRRIKSQMEMRVLAIYGDNAGPGASEGHRPVGSSWCLNQKYQPSVAPRFTLALRLSAPLASFSASFLISALCRRSGCSSPLLLVASCVIDLSGHAMASQIARFTHSVRISSTPKRLAADLTRFGGFDDDLRLVGRLAFGFAKYGELAANNFDRSRRFDSQSHPVASDSLDDHHNSPANHQMLSDFSA